MSRVYRNDGGGAFTDIGAGLPGADMGAAAWGDYDNDGDLDIFVSGCTAEAMPAVSPSSTATTAQVCSPESVRACLVWPRVRWPGATTTTTGTWTCCWQGGRVTSPSPGSIAT